MLLQCQQGTYTPNFGFWGVHSHHYWKGNCARKNMVYFCLPICWASIAVNLTKFGGDVPTPFTDQREFGVEEMKLMCSSTSNCWRINVVFRTCGAKNTSLTKFWTLGFSCATDVLFSSIAVMWIDLIQAVKSFTSNASLFFAYFKTAVERTFVPYTLNRGTRNTAGSYQKMLIIKDTFNFTLTNRSQISSVNACS